MTGLAVTPISTTEAVVVSLREKILDGAIEPGTPLPEVDLTREFGVARPTVRAAIQTLCHEGLLKRERNRSAFVPLLTREEVLDLFSVRIPIERLIVRELLTRNASLDGVHAAIGPLAALRVDSRWSQVVDADMGFHQALAHAAGSPRLERLYASLERRDPALHRAAAPGLGFTGRDGRRAPRPARGDRARRRGGGRGAHDRAPRPRRFTT